VQYLPRQTSQLSEDFPKSAHHQATDVGEGIADGLAKYKLVTVSPLAHFT